MYFTRGDTFIYTDIFVYIYRYIVYIYIYIYIYISPSPLQEILVPESIQCIHSALITVSYARVECSRVALVTSL